MRGAATSTRFLQQPGETHLMAERYNNPFQGIDVSIPAEFHADVARYSQHEGRALMDNNPFPRMVDCWFLAVCVAARLGLEPAETKGVPSKKIIEGSIFSTDPARVHALMLVAINHTGSIDIVTDPRRMMAIANGLAVAGLPKVLDMLKVGDGDPIWNLSDAVEGLLVPA